MSLETLGSRSLVVGAVGLAALVLGGVLDHEQLFRSYLFGYLPWAGLSLGALAILMLHHVASGEWGYVIRRILEAATKNLPLLAVLFVPVFLGMGSLYEWSQPSQGTEDRLLEHKDVYLNVPFYVVRTALYFAVWMLLAWRLDRLSQRQDRGEQDRIHPFQVVSGPGLVLYGLTVTFASIDWVMSLEFHWYSTIYGISFMTGQCLSILAFAAIALYLLSDQPPFDETVKPSHFQGLGNLILAFVMLWAYMALSQYLIIWSGNLPEGILWYLHRSGGWQVLALALIVLHFAAPFFLLLSRATKERGKILAGIATLILLMRFADNFWLVAPAFHPDDFAIHWMDVVAPVGIGGVWLWAFCRNLKKMPLLPLGDPRFAELAPSSREALSHGIG